MTGVNAVVGEFVRMMIIMSLSASALSLLLLLIKPLIRYRLPKSVQYYLWVAVLFTLLVPVSRFIVIPETSAPIATPIFTFVENNMISLAEESNRPAFKDSHNLVTATSAETVMENAVVEGNTKTDESTMITDRGMMTAIENNDRNIIADNIGETAVTGSNEILRTQEPTPPKPSLINKVSSGLILIYPWIVLLILIYSISQLPIFQEKNIPQPHSSA